MIITIHSTLSVIIFSSLLIFSRFYLLRMAEVTGSLPEWKSEIHRMCSQGDKQSLTRLFLTSKPENHLLLRRWKVCNSIISKRFCSAEHKSTPKSLEVTLWHNLTGNYHFLNRFHFSKHHSNVLAGSQASNTLELSAYMPAKNHGCVA